ncbi:hypothetical protein Syn7502_02832 [Synechococcus sp. PCC 7502]|uniref:hypothetical protein n=1 Tax=Synechococcus sp. PCC 7502 TaxID=1173263 RepID=UPI00029FC5DA|nr:hypothetical protein [Synechococcus sp. PCC 7502]AFY74769.1 hypothetical protein Syn7502_02832 [Synechococcus sp. PCC 7502]
MKSLLLPTDLQAAIVWTQREKTRTLIALDPMKVAGTETVKWLKQNGTARRQGTLKNYYVVDWQPNADWMTNELKNWQLPSQGSRTPSNYVKWD